MTENYDVVIVGGGIVGAACAAELSGARLRILVIDAGRVGCGTTGASMGHIVVMDDSEALLNLTAFSRELWLRLAKDSASACEYLPCGTLWVAADAEEMDVVYQKAKNYEEHDIAVEVLDHKSLYQYEPNLAQGLAGGLRVVGDCVIYPPNCAALLLQGIEVRENCNVCQISDNLVSLENGSEIRAEFIVNAAGAAAPKLTAELPVEPRKGHLVITARYPGFCQHQIVELGYLKSVQKMEKESVAFNIQPRPSGQYLIGSSREFAGWDDSINRNLVNRMLTRACDYMPALKEMFAIRTWFGYRPAPMLSCPPPRLASGDAGAGESKNGGDKLPIIGNWPKVKGLYIAAGHEGLGITTSLGTARLLAAEILGQPPPIDPAPYRPSRLFRENK